MVTRTGPVDPTVDVLVITDTDSYVKWGAALADGFPSAWAVSLVIASSTARPSATQVADALSGTRFEGSEPPVVGFADVRRILREQRPDVLVAAARGYTVQAVLSLVENTPDRPVIVTGLPGIGVPVLPYGLGFRRSADVFVVHSRRELREFAHAARRLGLPHHFHLGRLPYLRRGAERHAVSETGPLVFAAQALVPAGRSEREWLVERLADTARAHPQREVVVKVRARAGEAQTHHEQVSYEELVDALPDRPDNLVVRSGPMHAHLVGASGFVTVSSTALLEAVALDVPAVALTDFGVGVSQINLALADSGLMGTTDDLVAGELGKAEPDWCLDNYFHDPAEDTWLPAVEAALARRATQGLEPFVVPPGAWRNGFRNLLYRHFSFTDAAGRRGVMAFAERSVVLTALWLNQRRSFLLRSLWRSPRGARAQEFARENSATAPGAAPDASSPTPAGD